MKPCFARNSFGFLKSVLGKQLNVDHVRSYATVVPKKLEEVELPKVLSIPDEKFSLTMYVRLFNVGHTFQTKDKS